MSRAHLLVAASACALAACFVPDSAGDPGPKPGAAAGEKPAAPASGAGANGSDGTSQGAIGASPSGAAHPALTPPPPETARIVFAARLGADTSLDLWSILPDGSGLTKLTDTPHEDETFPRWSPDHARIAYVRDGQLVVANADGGGARMVAPNVGRDGYAISAPAWSPDGSELLYPFPRGAGEAGATVLHIVSATGAHDTALASGDVSSAYLTLTEPAWSSDGVITYLRSDECAGCAGAAAFVSIRGADQEVASIAGHGVDVSPDGAWWAFTINAERGASGYELPGAIAIGTHGGADAAPVTTNDAWMPRWSPTGYHVAFLRADGIWIMTSAGAHETRIFAKSGVRGIDW